jgi:hypothetical protein
MTNSTKSIGKRMKGLTDGLSRTLRRRGTQHAITSPGSGGSRGDSRLQPGRTSRRSVPSVAFGSRRRQAACPASSDASSSRQDLWRRNLAYSQSTLTEHDHVEARSGMLKQRMRSPQVELWWCICQRSLPRPPFAWFAAEAHPW